MIANFKTRFVPLFIFLMGCSIPKNGAWVKGVQLFKDEGTGHWQDQWMLDGEHSSITNTDLGMELKAGPEYGNDASHTVLWTKQSFEGDILIEYEYTRTDTTTRCVNILYFHATGKGDEGHPVDISLWNDKRTIPSMSTYFKNMNTYHISYAAFDAKEFSGGNDYIRLRRYDPNKSGLNETNISGDQFKTGLFKPFETYHIQVIKFDNQIEMRIKNKADESDELFCKWDVSALPPLEAGRIGLRHMYTRSARYKNFEVWSLE